MNLLPLLDQFFDAVSKKNRLGEGLRHGDVEQDEIRSDSVQARITGEALNALMHSLNHPQGIGGTDRMIAELELAITGGDSGEVACSPRAIKVLRSEPEKRRRAAPQQPTWGGSNLLVRVPNSAFRI